MSLRILDVITGLFGAGLILFLVVSTQRAPAPEPRTLAGLVQYVVDGDSLYLDSHEQQIRLWGVDAPERDEAGFQDATATLTHFAENKPVTCQQIDRDQYGRTVARCFLQDRREVNRLMIESGTATEYVQFSEGFYSSVDN